MHCQCEWKLAQPLWKNCKEVLQDINNRITILLRNPTSGYITKEKETIVLKRYLYTHIHIITALFTVVKVWKQPINRWKRKCDTHTHTHRTLFRLRKKSCQLWQHGWKGEYYTKWNKPDRKTNTAKYHLYVKY